MEHQVPAAQHPATRAVERIQRSSPQAAVAAASCPRREAAAVQHSQPC